MDHTGIFAVIIDPNPSQVSNSPLLVEQFPIEVEGCTSMLCQQFMVFAWVSMAVVTFLFLIGLVIWRIRVSAKAAHKSEQEIMMFRMMRTEY